MAIQPYIIEMLYYLILFLSVLFASSFLIIVFVALLRIVVNQQYPPLTKEYLSAEIVESICLCFVIVSAMFGWIPSDLQRRYLSNSSETLNIIIVPGYEMNRFSSMFLQKYLEARGHRVWAINNIFFADNLGQIIDTTRERILEICRQNELTEKIHLIGHSMGGIISCEIAKKERGKIGSIVTLGTPFMGTKIHMLGLKKHVHDLSEDSHYCLEDRQIECAHLCLWSSIDSIVLPSTNSRLAHLNNQEVLVGHLSFLFSTSVFRSIFDFYQSLQSESDIDLIYK